VIVFLTVFSISQSSEAFTGIPKSQEALAKSSRLASDLKDPRNNDQDKTHRASDDSREPAGVAALLFSRPKSVGASLRRGKKRASKFLRNRRWRIRKRRREGIIELAEDEQTVLDELDIPDWACVDEGERHRLGVMKALLKDDFERIRDCTVEQNGKQIHVMEAFPDVYGDLRLLRYLRKDRVQNPGSAASRYKSFLDWRRSNDVDTVRSDVERRPFSPPHQLDILRELMPCEFDVKEGGSEDTIPALLYVGQWDTAGVTKLIQKNEISVSCFMLYWTHIFESLNLKLHQVMMERKRMVFIDEIADLKGLSMGHFSPGFVQVVLKPWIKVTQANYPETTKRIIFLSPPRVISIIWNIVAPMASPGTVAKVQFKRDYPGSCMDYVRKNLSS